MKKEKLKSLKTKTSLTILICFLFYTACFAQQDLLPAFTNEINYIEDAAYFNGSPFTGILVEEKTNKKMGEFFNGYKNGNFIEYYENGKKKTEGKYINGLKEGTHTEWYSNGQQKVSYNYHKGSKMDGKYILYLETGQIAKEENYVNVDVPNDSRDEEDQSVTSQKIYFVAVEEMPEPIGGISAIQSKIVYPEKAKKFGISGKVYVLAFVDKSGDVQDVKIIRGIGAGCDEAAIDAVKKTKFKPGKQGGQTVNVQVAIPIIFKLD